MIKKFRMTTAAALAVAVLFTGFMPDAEARKSGSSFSRAASSVSKPSPRPASPAVPTKRSDSSANRLTQGNSSVGMTRQSSEQLRNDRASAPSYTAPAPSSPARAPASSTTRDSTPAFGTPAVNQAKPSAPSVPSPVAQPQYRASSNGSGSGSWVMPALIGAGVGAMAGHAMANNDSPAEDRSANSYRPATTEPPGAEGSSKGEEVSSSGTSSISNAFGASDADGSSSKSSSLSSSGALQDHFESTSLSLLGSVAKWFMFAVVVLGLFKVLKTVMTAGSSSPKRSPSEANAVEKKSASHHSASLREKHKEAFDYISDNATDLFKKIQFSFESGSAQRLSSVLTPEMLELLKPTLRVAEKPTIIISLSATLHDIAEEDGQLIASIHFKSVLDEQDGEGSFPLNEVYHFVNSNLKDPSDWLLAGVESLE